MAKEIERKFLVASDGWREHADKGIDLRQAYVVTMDDRSLRVRSDLVVALGPSLEARVGGEARSNDIELAVDSDRLDRNELIELFPSRTDHSAAGYVGLAWHPDGRLRIEPGVRSDLFSSQGAHAVSLDPRLVVAAQLSRRVAVEHRFGVASQKPNFVPGVPAAQVGSLERGLLRGMHASSTVRVSLPEEFSVSAGGFESRYENVVDPLGQAREFRLDAASLDRRQDLTARGLELRFGKALTAGPVQLNPSDPAAYAISLALFVAAALAAALLPAWRVLKSDPIQSLRHS